MTDRQTSIRARDARASSPFLNADQAAHYLHISSRLLRKLRVAGTGPDYRLHSHRVQYHIDDLDAWSAQNAVKGARP